MPLPKDNKESADARVWSFVFVISQFVRIAMAWVITWLVYKQRAVSTFIIYSYAFYIVLAFALFVAFNVYAYKSIGYTNDTDGYDLLLVFTLSVGYLIYYVVLLIIICVLPLTLCMLCCCPRVLTANARGWRPTP